MDKIKARINKLKQDIDVCEERESIAKGLLSEANARLDAAETEKNSFKRRLLIVKGEVAKTNERLYEKQNRLSGLESKTAEHEMAVKNLEDQEVEGDEMLGSLSDQLKRGQIEVETYDTQWREAKRKEAVLLNELDKAQSRFKESSARIEHFMKCIANTTDLIKDLEARESDQSERDTLNEEKSAFLTEQLKVAHLRVEAGERDGARLERIITKLKSDQKTWKLKTEDIYIQREELEEAAKEIS